ncbi:MAG: hypothetical protein IJ902_06245 [Prevotella sp.]|nr:hypothetical protein [Prevotella sp.]
MKSLKTILLVVLLVSGGLLNTSCTDYQDEIDALDFRVSYLEDLVKRMNSDIEALEIIAMAMESGDYITNVRETTDGYLINFANAGPIIIFHGADGKDGKDAEMPDITVEKDPVDGNLYWKINNVWLLVNGEKVRVNGKDGKDGKDAVSPQLRINPETGIWEISTDGGVSWISTGTSAKGRDGKDGKDGKDGVDGKDGKDGNQFFTYVSYESDGDREYMVITTKSGQTFRIPLYRN